MKKKSSVKMASNYMSRDAIMQSAAFSSHIVTADEIRAVTSLTHMLGGPSVSITTSKQD